MISAVFTDEGSLFFDTVGKLNLPISGKQVERSEPMDANKVTNNHFYPRQRPLVWLHAPVEGAVVNKKTSGSILLGGDDDQKRPC